MIRLRNIFLIAFLFLEILSMILYINLGGILQQLCALSIFACQLLMIGSVFLTYTKINTQIGRRLTIVCVYMVLVNWIYNIEYIRFIPEIILALSTFLIFSKWRYQNIEKPVLILFYAFSFIFFVSWLGKTMQRDNSYDAIHIIYFMIMLIPFLFLLKNKYYYLLTIITFSVFSEKRLPFIISVICFIMIMIYDVVVIKKQRKIYITSLLLFSFVPILMLSDVNIPIISRLKSLSEDGGSSRDVIYAQVYASFSNQPEQQKYFGNGHNAVKINDLQDNLSAHNDFLEILYDYGYVGLMLYAIFIISLINLTIRAKRVSSELFFAMLLSLVLFALISTFSMFIFAMKYSFILFAFWGIILSKYEDRIAARA